MGVAPSHVLPYPWERTPSRRTVVLDKIKELTQWGEIIQQNNQTIKNGLAYSFNRAGDMANSGFDHLGERDLTRIVLIIDYLTHILNLDLLNEFEAITEFGRGIIDDFDIDRVANAIDIFKSQYAEVKILNHTADKILIGSPNSSNSKITEGLP